MKIKDFIVGQKYYSTTCYYGDIIITVKSNDGVKVTCDWVRIKDSTVFSKNWYFDKNRLKEFNFIKETKLHKVLK